MQTPPIVSPEAWKDSWQRLLVKEKALTRARDALAAERRRMPWLAVETDYGGLSPDRALRLVEVARRVRRGRAGPGLGGAGRPRRGGVLEGRLVMPIAHVAAAPGPRLAGLAPDPFAIGNAAV